MTYFVTLYHNIFETWVTMGGSPFLGTIMFSVLKLYNYTVIITVYETSFRYSQALHCKWILALFDLCALCVAGQIFALARFTYMGGRYHFWRFLWVPMGSHLLGTLIFSVLDGKAKKVV